MYRHLYYLNREIHAEVLNNLALFITHTDLCQDLEYLKKNYFFKKFTTSAFKVSREQRPSVSQLSDYFRTSNCPLPGSLACEYAKELEAMAKQSGYANFTV